MADSQDVWGIEIGQAGLKAVHLRYAEAADQVLAMGHQYIPHPKILSQPDAIPEELIPQAIATFLEANDVRGSRVAVSLPGPTSLARFINLPPVESNKVAQIVEYEAKQQIPFDLDDVIWSYQKISGSVDEDSGYMLNAEVGLFAMKRDQVYETLQPFLDAGIEVDLVQIAPLALYNFVCYDQMGVRIEDDPDDLDEHTIVLDMGTDNTTLLITNGAKIWIRNVPLGGNHFTRALTKEMKLTFTKAEHLKCHATKSEDPRAVFQALRPVFNEYVSEIQRSIGYFSSVNRDAKIVRVLGCGNGFKLAGLQKFLQQSLQYDVERVESLQGVIGEKVLNSDEFQDNVLTFAVPLGLALQSLGVTRVHTTLLPSEIKTARLIRQKKPWAVIAASILLAGLAVDVFPRGCVDRSVRDLAVVAASKASDKAYSEITNTQGSYDTLVGEFDGEQLRQQTLRGGSERAELIPEVFRAINECLPREVGNQKDIQSLVRRNRIHISYMVHKRHGDLKTGWFDKVLGTRDGRDYMDPTERATAPTGSGYVFTMIGEHYHKGQDETDQLQFYVANTLLKNLRHPKLKTLGISHATLTQVDRKIVNYDPTGRVKMSDAGGSGSGTGGPTFGAVGATPSTNAKKAAKDVKFEKVDKTTFKLEFVWKPTPLSQRTAAVQAPADGGQPGTATPGTPTPPSTQPATTPPTGTGAF
jgi:type IV pilus assembly protein PilM